MLRFVWKVTHAGAPDDKDYATSADELFVRDAGGNDSLVQRFDKAQPGWHGVDPPLSSAIDRWLDDRGTDRAVVLVHGYSFDPDDPEKAIFDDNPYNGVFDDGNTGVTSWIPIVGRENAVCFAWTSAPSLGEAAGACWTNPYEYAVQDISVLAAKAVATIISALRDKGVTVDLLAHSLGTRVASKSLGWLQDKAEVTDAVRRCLMLGGAEYSLDALSDTGKVSTDIYNFAIRADGVLKWGASRLGGKQRAPNSMASRVIGRDGMKRTDRWIDFQLDHRDPDNAEEFRSWFDDVNGYKLSGKPTGGRGEHWAYFLNPENGRLYRDILNDPGLSIQWMRSQSAPDGVDRFRYQELSGRAPRTPTTCRDRHRLYDRSR